MALVLATLVAALWGVATYDALWYLNLDLDAHIQSAIAALVGAAVGIALDRILAERRIA